MANEPWNRIETLFHAAVNLGPEDRQRFLDEACAGDAPLRQEIESLLLHHDREPSVFGKGGAAIAAAILNETLEAGERVGPYEIARRLGGGGMGEVYEARDTRLGRRVAVKFLAPLLSTNSNFIARFQREAQIASALNHPNIVTIHDIGEENGRIFLVTEYVDGVSLRERLASSPLSEAHAIDIATQVAAALAAAHQAGIIHRDIKPENVMIRSDGYVRVLDFGLAKPVDGGSADHNASLTQSGIVLGTLRYMSPEQVRGEELDARTDIWSFGVVLYEMIAGQGTVQGHTPQEVAFEISGRPLRSGRLDRIVRRATAVDRGERYQSAEEIMADLKSAEWFYFPSRRMLRTVGIALLASALVVATSAAYRRIKGSSPLPIESELLTTNGKTGFAAISPDGQYLAFTLRQPGAESLRLRQTGTGVESNLISASEMRYVGVTFSKDGHWIYYVARGNSPRGTLYRVSPLGGPPIKIIEDVDSPVALSSDGKWVVFVREWPDRGENGMVKADLESGVERTLATRKSPHLFSRAGPSWSPDQRQIATAATGKKKSTSTLTFIDAESGAEHELAALPVSWIGRVAWLPNGNELVVSATRGLSLAAQILRVAYPSGDTAPVTSDVSDYYDVTVPDIAGGQIAAVRSEEVTNISLLPDGDTGRKKRITLSPSRYRDIAYMPDGRLLTTWMGDLWLFQADGSSARLNHTEATELSARPCGKHLVFSSNRSGSWNIWRTGLDGLHPKQLTSGSTPARSPFCTPDGKEVVFESSRSGRYTIAAVSIDGTEPRQLTATLSRSPAVSPDGRFVACEWSINGKEWKIAILPITGGEPTRLLDGIPAGSKVRWHPSGKALTFLHTRLNVTEVWKYDIATKQAQPVTHFGEDQVFAHDWSPDGKSLVVVHGVANENAVRIRVAR